MGLDDLDDGMLLTLIEVEERVWRVYVMLGGFAALGISWWLGASPGLLVVLPAAAVGALASRVYVRREAGRAGLSETGIAEFHRRTRKRRMFWTEEGRRFREELQASRKDQREEVYLRHLRRTV